MKTDAGLYARSFADVYDAWYGELDDPAHLVGAVAARAKARATVLELGSGTGRLAGPLHEHGFKVIALDIATDMLHAATAGPHHAAADMAQLPLRPSSVDVVLIAYNTLFTVPDGHLQLTCLREVSRCLRPGGLLAIEAFVAPSEALSSYAITTKAHPTDPARRIAILTGPAPDEPGVIHGSHVEFGGSSAESTCRPWSLVYQSPAALDELLGELGFGLKERRGNWQGADFVQDGDRHVSWYERM